MHITIINLHCKFTGLDIYFETESFDLMLLLSRFLNIDPSAPPSLPLTKTHRIAQAVEISLGFGFFNIDPAAQPSISLTETHKIA